MAGIRHIEDCQTEEERTLFSIEVWLIHVANGYEGMNMEDIQIGAHNLLKEYFPKSEPYLKSEKN
jgi:hypothetical protein